MLPCRTGGPATRFTLAREKCCALLLFVTTTRISCRDWSPVDTNRLQCVECGRVSREDERGWAAHLATDEDGPAEAVLYRPECEKREFGR